MKNFPKILFLLSISIGFTQAYGQYKHQVYVGYGIGTHHAITDAIVDISVAAFTLSNPDSKSHTGAFFAGYRNQVTERIALGGLVVYEHAKSSSMDGDKTYNLDQNNMTLMADFQYAYTRSEKLKLFSGVSAGASMLKSKITGESSASDSKVDFGFHLDVIGLSYGKKTAPFLAVGYGYKGIINLGLQTRF